MTPTFARGERQVTASGVSRALQALCLVLCGFVSAQAASGSLSAPGRVTTRGGIVSVGTPATGTVAEIPVREGARVKTGDVVARINCRPIEDEIDARELSLAGAESVLARVRAGSRSEEIAVATAAVGYSRARAEEAAKSLERVRALTEGVSITRAQILLVERDARVSAAQLQEAWAKLALLKAGSRSEDIREAEARRDAAAAQLREARSRLDQCSVRAPIDGVVAAVLATPGQLVSSAWPVSLIDLDHIVIRTEVPPFSGIKEGDLAEIAVQGEQAFAPARVTHVGVMLVQRMRPPLLGAEVAAECSTGYPRLDPGSSCAARRNTRHRDLRPALSCNASFGRTRRPN